MEFAIKRKLSNQEFTTEVAFDKYGTDEITAEEEKEIIEDFGPVIVSVGGTFEGYATASDNSVTVVAPSHEHAANITFTKNASQATLKEGVVISFSCNATKEKQVDSLTALQVAEAKCKVFEMVMKDRITKTLKAFKEQKTTFETEKINNFSA